MMIKTTTFSLFTKVVLSSLLIAFANASLLSQNRKLDKHILNQIKNQFPCLKLDNSEPPDYSGEFPLPSFLDDLDQNESNEFLETDFKTMVGEMNYKELKSKLLLSKDQKWTTKIKVGSCADSLIFNGSKISYPIYNSDNTLALVLSDRVVTGFSQDILYFKKTDNKWKFINSIKSGIYIDRRNKSVR